MTLYPVWPRLAPFGLFGPVRPHLPRLANNNIINTQKGRQSKKRRQPSKRGQPKHQSTKIKDDIWNAKTTKVKVYIMINTLEGGGGADGGLPLPCQTIFLLAGVCFRNFQIIFDNSLIVF